MVKVLSKRISIWLAKLWRQHPGVVFSLVVALIPFCVTVLYNIHIVDHRTISPEAVLAYLGGALGIGFSFFQYLAQKEKNSRESRNRRRPFLSLEISKADDCFDLNLKNLGASAYTDVFLFDESVAGILMPGENLSVAVGANGDGALRPSSLSGWDVDVDDEGYPREVVFYLHDSIDMQWIASFLRSKSGSKTVYFGNIEEGEC
ncbi:MULTISPECIES: hypothetical protein [Adlercreutzia]|uniref:hypothetical protein n=1 Tax=Adlercreutzia TaxID=447020 RepID=UPI0012EC30AA|nr:MULTISPECIES: hypothetical protein [Adlercreutzia]MCR2034787.1 hypothetical protein [Adlercreutzia mucosicola]MEB1812902.1 hypothetical protein [Adlercreutzia mucosicola]